MVWQLNEVEIRASISTGEESAIIEEAGSDTKAPVVIDGVRSSTPVIDRRDDRRDDRRSDGRSDGRSDRSDVRSGGRSAGWSDGWSDGKVVTGFMASGIEEETGVGRAMTELKVEGRAQRRGTGTGERSLVVGCYRNTGATIPQWDDLRNERHRMGCRRRHSRVQKDKKIPQRREL